MWVKTPCNFVFVPSVRLVLDVFDLIYLSLSNSLEKAKIIDTTMILKLNLLKARSKFKNYATISFMFDKTGLLGYKDSPIDDGKDIFLKLFKERIII